MNIAALIDLLKEVFNSKDDSTKRIAAGLTAIYLLAQIPQIHDALIAFATAHQAGIEGLLLGAVIAALFKNPNKSTLQQASQEESSNADTKK